MFSENTRRALRVCALFLALISALTLCACGRRHSNVVGSDGSSGDTSAGTPERPTGETSTPTEEGSQTPPDSETPPASSPTPSGSETPTPTPPPVLETERVSAKNVRHIFTHCLINDPSKGCSYAGAPLDVDCLTVKEFKALLESLYKNGFCLINIHDMYVVDENGKAKLADYVTVNKGKKPLVISIDDVTYDPRKKGSGMVDRLVIENGTIMGCYDNADGTTTLTDGEVFPIIEQFIKDHPDFSCNGNKVTLALTGFAGILGYRTDEQYADQGIDVAGERQKAQIVVDWLKANGYNFACHSYSHSDYTNCSLSRVERDVEMWNRNVKPLIGETKVFVYPYGAFTYQNTAKHNLLLKEGFVMFCGTSQLNTLWDGSQPKEGGGAAKNTGTIYLERFTVTGFTLRMYGSEQSYYDYYYNYFKSGNSDDTAKQKAQDYVDRFYATGRNNSLEYYVPEEIYDHENRYEKIK